MPKPHNIMIHEFQLATKPHHYDDEGDLMVGFYFQFTNQDDTPMGSLIGPYAHAKAAENAAIKAFNTNDY